ncbi:hypothetical protein FVEN_g60 [Fusarium venenatum]|nr:hypothetical protein FVEN_g60 [Fusarium venenatum]
MRLQRKSWSELRQVYHLSELKAPADGIDIVVVPGLWAQGCPKNEENSCSWLKLLLASTDQDTRVFIFTYDIDSTGAEDGHVWHQLLVLGGSLLDNIRQARPVDYHRRPLYFICHGLGGIILKRALNLAHHDYPNIHNALSGIVFLGTPHLCTTEDDRWDNWRKILQLYRKDVPKTVLRNEDKESLAYVCEQFSALNLPVPILSVFESTETKVPASGLGFIRKGGRLNVKLVDRVHAAVNTTHEELVPADSPHSGLPVVIPGTSLFQRMIRFIHKAPLEGKSLVTKAFGKLQISYTISYTDTESHCSPPNGSPERDSSPGSSVTGTRTVLLPCHMLGQTRNRGFFGQKSILEQIEEALKLENLTVDDNSGHSSGEEEEPLQAFALCGIGGLGKTEIAVEFAHSHKSDFDAIFWVNSASTDKLNGCYRNMAVQLGLSDEAVALREDPESIREIVKAWLSNPIKTMGAGQDLGSKARWLIVFDNADDPDILSDFWPLNGPGSILITSRNPLAKQDPPGFANLLGIDLPSMTPQDAGAWLQGLSRREKEQSGREVCETIAERMGGLPLAIVQMAYLIRTKHLSLSEFLESYNHDARRFQSAPVKGMTRQQTVASIWNIESLTPSALALLRILSVLDPDNIPENMLMAGADKVDLDDYPKDKFEYMDARAELIQSSLITRNMELGFLKIHRLVQDVVRDQLGIAELRSVFDAAVVLLSTVWPFFDETNELGSDRLRKVQEYLPHADTLQELVKEKSPEKLKPNIAVASLFNEAAWFFILQSWGFNLRSGFEYARLSQQILNANSEGQDTNRYSYLLTNSYRYQGITSIYMLTKDAVPCCKKWIELLVDRIQKYKEPVDIKTLPISYNELGIALMTIPDTKEALKAFETCCEMLDQQRKSDKLPFPFAWQHRGTVTAWSGNPDAGYEILAPILKEREDKLGKDNTEGIEDGHLLTYMGNIRRLQGQSDWYNFAKRGLSVLRITCGENASFTIQASYRLARAHFERAEYDEAIALLRKCVAFPGDVPWYKADLGRYCWKLGRALQASGNSGSETRELLKRSMDIRHDLVPNDDREEDELTDSDWDELIYVLYR